MSAAPRIKEGLHFYHATVQWWCDREIKNAAPASPSKIKEATLVIHAGAAAAALAQLHTTMQRQKETNLDRKVTRPMLLPTEYKIIKLCIPYVDVSKKELEQVFDVPAGGNPDLRTDKTPPPETPMMGFFEEAKGQGKLSS